MRVAASRQARTDAVTSLDVLLSVGGGAMAVQFVHVGLARQAAATGIH